jgi:hypothetical protein
LEHLQSQRDFLLIGWLALPTLRLQLHRFALHFVV